MIFRSVPRSLSRALGALFLCVALVGAGGCGGGPAPAAPPSPRTGATAPAWAKGMATVRADALPPQAREVLALIDKGGPYAYRQDGAVFGNFEKVLPKQKRGYYHEYTVKTPGERDRGARRIVTGEGGEFYYTDDHYETFKAVLR
ncbi:ribonuclease T1 [Streptomyces sp. 3211.6]|uniref:ribonuclease domain-containing protein n=1 Tax=Streptomyces TaxID=1883 RepID=UPI0009A50880|nr:MULTISPECIES: ribonuclease domain-containing protein [Streptomyces]RKT03636.1 ribonuclease T1 [Streptomyces sp. 3211.6]RPF39505.1 ribonuclease T1 [Streptomyces sp. Ag109_G2-6]